MRGNQLWRHPLKSQPTSAMRNYPPAPGLRTGQGRLALQCPEDRHSGQVPRHPRRRSRRARPTGALTTIASGTPPRRRSASWSIPSSTPIGRSAVSAWWKLNSGITCWHRTIPGSAAPTRGTCGFQPPVPPPRSARALALPRPSSSCGSSGNPRKTIWTSTSRPLRPTAFQANWVRSAPASNQSKCPSYPAPVLARRTKLCAFDPASRRFG